MIVAQDTPGAVKKPGADNSDDSLLANQDSALGPERGAADGAGAQPTAAAGAHKAPSAASPAEEEDLLGISFGGGAAPAAAATTGSYYVPASVAPYAPTDFGGAGVAGAVAPAPFALVPNAVLEPMAFQSKWGALPTAQTLSLRLSRLPQGPGEGRARGGRSRQRRRPEGRWR